MNHHPRGIAPAPDDAFRLRAIAVPAYGPSLLGGFGVGAVTPVLPLVALGLGASTGQAGLVVTLVMIGSLSASLPGSVLTARFGERAALVGSALVDAAMLALLAWAPSLPVVGAAAYVLGIGQVVFALARQTYLTEAIPVRLRARALSSLGGVLRIGSFLGPLAGAGVILLWDRRAVFVMAVVLMLAAAVLAARLPELPGERTVRRDGEVHLLDVVRGNRRFFGTLGLGILLLMAVRGARIVVLPLWAEHLGLSDAATSLVVAVSWGVDTMLFYPGGWVMDRFGRRVAAMPTTLGMALAFALLPLTTGFWSLLAVGVLMALGNGFGSGIVMTISADASPDVGRPQFLGAARFLSDLGSAAGPAVVSLLAGVASLGVGVGAVAAMAVAAAAVFLTWLPHSRPGAAAAVAGRFEPDGSLGGRGQPAAAPDVMESPLSPRTSRTGTP